MDNSDTEFKLRDGGDDRDRWLDDTLRDLSSEHVADDGFTSKVVESLPAGRSRGRRGRWLTDWWPIAVAVVIAAVFMGRAFYGTGESLISDTLRSLEGSVVILGVSLPFISVLSLLSGIIGGILVLDRDR